MVPLTDELLTMTILRRRNTRCCLSLPANWAVSTTHCSAWKPLKPGIKLDTVLYNLYPTVEDRTIQEDTQLFIQRYLKKDFPETNSAWYRNYKSLQGTSETTIDDTD